MRGGGVASRVSRYLREDFKEIVNPSAMPNPRWYEEKARAGAGRGSQLGTLAVLRRALEEYRKGWGAFLSSGDGGRGGEGEQEHGGGHDPETSGQGTTDDLSKVAAEVGKKGAETARPYLQRLYRTRVSSYRDAIKEFSVGFGEGLSGRPRGDAARDGEGKSVK